MLHEVRYDQAARQEGSRQIHVHHVPDLPRRHLVQRPEPAGQPGVVDPDVHPIPAVEGVLQQPLQAALLGDVHGDARDAEPLVSEPGDHLVHRRLPAGADNDPRAFPGARFGHSAADAPGGARHDDDLVSQLHS